MRAKTQRSSIMSFSFVDDRQVSNARPHNDPECRIATDDEATRLKACTVTKRGVRDAQSSPNLPHDVVTTTADEGHLWSD